MPRGTLEMTLQDRPARSRRPLRDEHAPGHVEDSREQPGPASPESFLLKVTIPKSARDKLQYAQTLLSHTVPTGDVAQVLERALDALIPQLERRKFGAITRRSSRQRTTLPDLPTSARRQRSRASVRKRHIPAHVRRAVWERDQGQCTFLSSSGTRCKAHRFLEFDHVDPVARGGEATVERIRLRCRVHNQHEAERMFGAGFMARKRQEARLAAAEARALAACNAAGTRAEAAAEADETAEAKEQTQDVLTGLRSLGCRGNEARRAAEFSQALHGATLEERMRAALKFLGNRVIQSRAPMARKALAAPAIPSKGILAAQPGS